MKQQLIKMEIELPNCLPSDTQASDPFDIINRLTNLICDVVKFGLMAESPDRKQWALEQIALMTDPAILKGLDYVKPSIKPIIPIDPPTNPEVQEYKQLELDLD